MFIITIKINIKDKTWKIKPVRGQSIIGVDKDGSIEIWGDIVNYQLHLFGNLYIMKQ